MCETEPQKQGFDMTKWTVLQNLVRIWVFLSCDESHVSLASLAEHSTPAALPLFSAASKSSYTQWRKEEGKKKWTICRCRWGFVDGVQVAVTE